jgi:hypothetical protein
VQDYNANCLKPIYTMDVKKAQANSRVKQMLEFLQTYGNFPLWQPGGAAQTIDQVRLQVLERLDQELFTNLRLSPPPPDTPLPVADWLVVVASAARLEEVESFINIFAAGVPQIEIEAKIVEVTTTDTLDLGVRQVDAATPTPKSPARSGELALTAAQSRDERAPVRLELAERRLVSDICLERADRPVERAQDPRKKPSCLLDAQRWPLRGGRGNRRCRHRCRRR